MTEGKKALEFKHAHITGQAMRDHWGPIVERIAAETADWRDAWIYDLITENERLREALSWAEDADPVLADAIRNRAGLGEKRDLPKCFGSIEVTHPQSRAENCCDDCPVEGLCRAALGEKQ